MPSAKIQGKSIPRGEGGRKYPGPGRPPPPPGGGGGPTPPPPPPPPQNNPGGYTQAALATACELVVGVISLEQTQALKVWKFLLKSWEATPQTHYTVSCLLVNKIHVLLSHVTEHGVCVMPTQHWSSCSVYKQAQDGLPQNIHVFVHLQFSHLFACEHACCCVTLHVFKGASALYVSLVSTQLYGVTIMHSSIAMSAHST